MKSPHLLTVILPLVIFINTLSSAQISPSGIGLAEPPSASLANQAEAGARVLDFCRSRIGHRVGNGQCASLAVKALERAGARGMGKNFPNPGDYVWGDFITAVFAGRNKPGARLDWIRGGDIIQFRNVRFAGRTPGGGTYWMQADHHTAIVESADATGNTLHILHQNWNGNLTVRRDVLRLSDLSRGWLRIYRPVR